MRISDWSSDVCSSDLRACPILSASPVWPGGRRFPSTAKSEKKADTVCGDRGIGDGQSGFGTGKASLGIQQFKTGRSEEHTSELQSLMRISYAVFCLKKKKKKKQTNNKSDISRA